MELFFIRHGEPAWSIGGLSQPDPYLTERGALQASLAAERLSAEEPPITEILVSPALRSQQTAQPLVDATQIAPTTIDDLVEIQMPNWEGELEETVQRVFKEARHRPPEDWWNGLAGGESFRGFHERITNTMGKILGERGYSADRNGHPHLWDYQGEPSRIAIVAHGGTNAVALSFLLGVDPTPWEWERFVLGHCSIARVKTVPLAGGHVFSLRTFNDREHLAPELRTR